MPSKIDEARASGEPHIKLEVGNTHRGTQPRLTKRTGLLASRFVSSDLQGSRFKQVPAS